MNFGFTEEQELLRDGVRKFLAERCPMSEVRRLSETAEGFSRDLWLETARLGWPGLAVAEEYGGAGQGFVDLVVLLEETGRALHPSPLLSTTLAGVAISDSGSEAQRARWLPGLASGETIGTVALLEASDFPGADGVRLEARRDADGLVLDGEKRFVADGAAADLFVVACRIEGSPVFAIVDRGATGLETVDVPCIDSTKRLATLRLGGVRISRDAVLSGRPGDEALERLVDRGAAAVSAEMLGAADAALALTVAYAKERIQFGSPIGRFQGVKHPLAELYVDVESSKSLLHYAAWALDQGAADASKAVSLAKAYATETFSRLGIDVVQLHGGIGYTWEYDAQLYLKRAKWARPAFGDADHHYDRAAALGGM